MKKLVFYIGGAICLLLMQTVAFAADGNINAHCSCIPAGQPPE